MEIFIDSADVSEIKKWLGYGVIDGVTTNPSVMFKDKVYDVEKGAKQIARLIEPRPMFVEVTTNDLDEMVSQALNMASWAANISVKIPVINQDGQPCLGVISELSRQGVKVNATACLSFSQVVLSAKAGAAYISIFGGRVSDEGGDAPLLIRQSAEWLVHWKYQAKIIVGSVRAVIDIQQAAIAGAHIVTVPPQFLGKMVDHKYTRETVKQFVGDAAKALEMMEKARGS